MSEIIQTLIVNRDGRLDLDWLETVEAIERKARLKQVGREAIYSTMHTAISVGKGIVDLLSNPAGGYPEPVKKQ